MIAAILCIHATVILDKVLNTYELEKKQNIQNNLMNFCSNICGERTQQNLLKVIEANLGISLNFENAYMLYYEENTLLSLNYIINDKGKLMVSGFAPVPKSGLTGKCLADNDIVISRYGKNDPSYSVQSDNILKLKKIYNFMAVPLIVSKNNGKIIKGKKEEKEIVGILQLYNYNEGNIEEIDTVYLT